MSSLEPKLNMCWRCRCREPQVGRSTCFQCTPRQKKYNDARYEYGKRNNLCVHCHRSKPDGRVSCPSCIQHQLAWQKKKHKMRKKAHICIQCAKPVGDIRWVRCFSCRIGRQKRRIHLKELVIAHYGGRCACPPCQETEIRFLTMDHVLNDGNRHRLSDSRVGSNIYRWLKNNKFPCGFQVLCMNCNWGRANNGGTCPHLDKDRLHYGKITRLEKEPHGDI
jgi:hypothetical protein